MPKYTLPKDNLCCSLSAWEHRDWLGDIQSIFYDANDFVVYFRNSIICTRDRRKLDVSIELECDVTNIPALIMIYRHRLSVFEFLSVMVREDGSALVVWQDVVNRFDFRRTWWNVPQQSSLEYSMRHHKRDYRRMACIQIFGKERMWTERSARGHQRSERRAGWF